MNKPIPGKYKYYKGNFYKVLDTVLHSETLEELVLYKPLYETNDEFNDKMWVRPVAMFMEKVEIDGKLTPRFKRVL